MGFDKRCLLLLVFKQRLLLSGFQLGGCDLRFGEFCARRVVPPVFDDETDRQRGDDERKDPARDKFQWAEGHANHSKVLRANAVRSSRWSRFGPLTRRVISLMSPMSASSLQPRSSQNQAAVSAACVGCSTIAG